MNKIFKETIIQYILIVTILVSISIFACCSYIYIIFGEKPFLEHIHLTAITTIVLIAIIAAYTYIIVKNFLLIILWAILTKLCPQCLLTKFLYSLKNNNHKKCIFLLTSLIIDFCAIKLIQQNYTFIDTLLLYLEGCTGLTINLLTLYLYWFTCDKTKIFKSKIKKK